MTASRCPLPASSPHPPSPSPTPVPACLPLRPNPNRPVQSSLAAHSTPRVHVILWRSALAPPPPYAFACMCHRPLTCRRHLRRHLGPRPQNDSQQPPRRSPTLLPSTARLPPCRPSPPLRKLIHPHCAHPRCHPPRSRHHHAHPMCAYARR
jgi:hypothetical protein